MVQLGLLSSLLLLVSCATTKVQHPEWVSFYMNGITGPIRTEGMKDYITVSGSCEGKVTIEDRWQDLYNSRYGKKYRITVLSEYDHKDYCFALIEVDTSIITDPNW